MSNVEIGALYLQVVVWPVVAIVAFIVFRKPISTLVENVRRVAGFGGEIETHPQQGAELLEETVSRFRQATTEQLTELLGGREAAEKNIEQLVRANFVECDVAPIFAEPHPMKVTLGYNQNMRFSDFLDRIWAAFGGKVGPYSYGILWQLRFAETREALVHQHHYQRTVSNRVERSRLRDTRTLQEVGIRPGMLLVAEPLYRAPMLFAGGEPIIT